MSKIGIRVKLNVSKIEKQRLFKGSKGLYLDCTAFIDLDQQDQYGNNGFCSQDVSKEEREQGVKGPILGNVQVFYRGDQQAAPQQTPAQQKQGGDFMEGYDKAAKAQGFDDFEEESVPF